MVTLLKMNLFCLCLLACSSRANDTWEGKVVGVSDGDTLTVLQGSTPLRIRLYGIDTPEKHQAFGERAKQFTSRLVFGKQVTVKHITKDKWGRTVASVSLGAMSLGEELLKAGLAWHFRKYCTSETYARLESMARKEKRGLWADKEPTPPWAWRSVRRNADRKPSLKVQAAAQGQNQEDTAKAKGQVQSPKFMRRDGVKKFSDGEKAHESTPFRGNVKTKAFHAVGCKEFHCKNCMQAFQSMADAIRAGYHPHNTCVKAQKTSDRCFQDCLRSRQMKAISWEAIKAECRTECKVGVSKKNDLY